MKRSLAGRASHDLLLTEVQDISNYTDKQYNITVNLIVIVQDDYFLSKTLPEKQRNFFCFHVALTVVGWRLCSRKHIVYESKRRSHQLGVVFDNKYKCQILTRVSAGVYPISSRLSEPRSSNCT